MVWKKEGQSINRWIFLYNWLHKRIKMMKTKETRAITLISLVVTIVVLLILAGVSINLVLGNNGIITKAKEAREKSAQASQNDLVAMGELAQQLENTLNGSENSGVIESPQIMESDIKVVTNSDGTGSDVEEASIFLGNTLYINFEHSVTGGTTSVSPSIPYAVTANGTYNFTVTGTVKGKHTQKI